MQTFLILLAAALQNTPPPTPALVGNERLVILVRHAEKAAEPAEDPPLTDAGLARAAALGEAVAHAHVGAVVVTPFRRTRETGDPLRRAGAAWIEVDVAGGLDAHVAAVAAAVRARPPGETVVVVGHSNTIPRIVTALGGPAIADLCDGEYATLFVLTVPDSGTPHLVRASYGTPDPPEASSCQAAP